MSYFSDISYMISHIFLMLFIFLFTKHRYSGRKTALICVSAFGALCFFDQLKLLVYPDSVACYFVVTLIQIFITQFTAVFICTRRNSKAFFMGLSSSNYVIAGSVAASILHIYTGNAAAALIGSFAVHLAILLVLSFRIRAIWLRNFDRENVTNWWELCLIPVFFYCGFTFLAFFPYTLYDNPDNIPGTIIFIVTMFVSYIVVLRYMEIEYQKTNIYWKNVLYKSCIRGLEDQYHLVEQSEQNLKILRHDMRHYSGMISSLLDQEEYAEIRRVVDHINEVTDENRITKYCDDLIINTGFSNLMDQACARGIEVRHDIRTGKDQQVSSCELAVVMANLFENALNCVAEFVENKPWVSIKLHSTENYLLLQVENEYGREIPFDAVSGLPKSGKGSAHGFGMQSAQAFSDKIGGSLGCYCEEGVFHIMIYAKFQGDFL